MVKGTLVVKPKTAVLKYDTEVFGTMDPYVIITIGSQKKQSSVAQDQGKKPVWNDTLTFNITTENLLRFQLFDKDTFSRDDFIAEGSYALGGLFNGMKTTEHINCTRKGKMAGQIVIEFSFVPDNNNAYGQYPQQPQYQNFNHSVSMQQNYHQPHSQQVMYSAPPQQMMGYSMPPQQFQYQQQPPPQMVYQQPPPQQQYYQQQPPMMSQYTNNNQQYYQQQQPQNCIHSHNRQNSYSHQAPPNPMNGDSYGGYPQQQQYQNGYNQYNNRGPF